MDFMMRFELGLEKPEPRRAMASAVTIATAYIVGGFIPLGPYMAMNVTAAFPASVALTLLSARDLWVCEGALHRGVADAKRPSSGIDRRIGRHGGIRDRKSDLMTRAVVAACARTESEGGRHGSRALGLAARGADRRHP